jgi:hypothetical protein
MRLMFACAMAMPTVVSWNEFSGVDYLLDVPYLLLAPVHK